MSTYETDQLNEIERQLRRDDAAFVAAFERRAAVATPDAPQAGRWLLGRLAVVAVLVVALVVIAALADSPALALTAIAVAVVAGWSAVGARRRRETRPRAAEAPWWAPRH